MEKRPNQSESFEGRLTYAEAAEPFEKAAAS